jgi:hypothetical protein
MLVSDRGPAAPQTPIPAAGTTINNISLTHLGVPGPILLFAHVVFKGGALHELVEIEIWRNGAGIPTHVGAALNLAYALCIGDIHAHAAVDDSQPGDVYTIHAWAGASTAGIQTNDAQLTMAGIPGMRALAAQTIATP